MKEETESGFGSKDDERKAGEIPSFILVAGAVVVIGVVLLFVLVSKGVH